MKQIIKDVLRRHEDSQQNLSSESARNLIASEIEAVLDHKGTYHEYTDSEIEEEKAREHWVCSICGKSTFEVDYDYIGSGTNHLGCELSSKEHSLENKASWSETHSQFVTDDVVEKHKRGPDRRKSDRRENEMKLIADKCGVDWEMALEGFVRDGRVGHSHMNIPGPDGKFGFGGSCFPKDIQAIINFGESLGLDMDTLNGVWKTNLKVRPEKDWEKLKGRAVS